MKNIIWSIIILFAVLLSVNFVSACFSVDYEFTSTIMGIKPAQDITIEKIMQLCTQETCIINEDTKTITIQSHFDNRVALIFSQDYAQYPDNSSKISLIIKLPYKLNQSCSEPKICYPIPDKINPDTYDWKTSIKTDLTYLKSINIIDISEKDIGDISNNRGNIVYCEGGWTNADGCAYYLKDVNDSSPTYQETILIPEGHKVYVNCGGAPGFLSILPIKEFTSDKKSFDTFPDLVYWIIGIGVVIVVLVLLLIKKKK